MQRFRATLSFALGICFASTPDVAAASMLGASRLMLLGGDSHMSVLYASCWPNGFVATLVLVFTV